MKTAMQELLDELKLIEAYPMSPLVLKMATDLLIKEKEQIVKAHNEGIWIEGKAFDDGEEYYNNNYGE